jgi:hypothetical protein
MQMNSNSDSTAHIFVTWCQNFGLKASVLSASASIQEDWEGPCSSEAGSEVVTGNPYINLSAIFAPFSPIFTTYFLGRTLFYPPPTAPPSMWTCGSSSLLLRFLGGTSTGATISFFITTIRLTTNRHHLSWWVVFTTKLMPVLLSSSFLLS